jgi:hypothetical protein
MPRARSAWWPENMRGGSAYAGAGGASREGGDTTRSRPLYTAGEELRADRGGAG